MSKTEWFSEWFNTSYYHLLYNHRNEPEAENFIKAISETFDFSSGINVCDLACGKGRHSIMCQKLGAKVIGLDISEQSILYAQKFSNERLSFKVADMRTVFANKEFDLVLNLFTSFGYFDTEEEDVLVLKNIYTALKNGGNFLIDYLNIEKVRFEGKVENTLVKDGVTFFTQKYIENGFIIKKISVQDKNDFFYFYEKVKQINLNLFKQMLEEAGFEIKEIWGDYYKNDFNSDSSDRLIIRCLKR